MDNSGLMDFGTKLLAFADERFQLKGTFRWRSNSARPEDDPRRLARFFKQRIRFEKSLMVLKEAEDTEVHFFTYFIFYNISYLLYQRLSSKILW